MKWYTIYETEITIAKPPEIFEMLNPFGQWNQTLPNVFIQIKHPREDEIKILVGSQALNFSKTYQFYCGVREQGHWKLRIRSTNKDLDPSTLELDIRIGKFD